MKPQTREEAEEMESERERDSWESAREDGTVKKNRWKRLTENKRVVCCERDATYVQKTRCSCNSHRGRIERERESAGEGDEGEKNEEPFS